MGMGSSSFAVRQKVGVWGEQTFLHHFSTHTEHGLYAFEYGEMWKGKRKKDQSHAVCRPDLLLVKTSELENLAKKGIIPNPGLDLRALRDDDPTILEIVSHALAAVEVKFSHRRYVEGHVQFIIDEGRKARYEEWLTRTKGIGALMVWLTTDRAWIATVNEVLKNGKQEVRTYENRGSAARQKMTWNLPVEKTRHFANVTGYQINETLKASFQWTTSGGLEVDVTDDPGDFDNVDVASLLAMAKSVRR
jgi:hypothetical protein